LFRQQIYRFCTTQTKLFSDERQNKMMNGKSNLCLCGNTTFRPRRMRIRGNKT
jgi:hypothetical protein